MAHETPAVGLVWGACGDCGVALWVTPQARDPHCGPCHCKRLGFPPLPPDVA